MGGSAARVVRRYIPRQEMQFKENVKCRRGPRTGDWTRYSFVELVIQQKSVVGCRGREKKFKISKFKISLWRCDWLRSVPKVKVSASYHSLQDQDEDQGRAPGETSLRQNGLGVLCCSLQRQFTGSQHRFRHRASVGSASGGQI